MDPPLDQVPSCRLLCPFIRYFFKNEQKQTTSIGAYNIIINRSYLISQAELESEDDTSVSESEDDTSISHWPMQHLNEEEGEVQNDKLCSLCGKKILGKTCYVCKFDTCRGTYHKDCIESPSVIHSLDHPKHPLQLFWLNKSNSVCQRQCRSCGDGSGYLFYYCISCCFSIHPICIRNPTPLTIENKRRHEHILHYFPRRSDLVCDVCGLEDDIDYLYVCLLCDFIIHKCCIYLPYVIKVSRHNHRLAFTPNNIPYNLELNDDKCGVCHTKINKRYGEYCCMKGCVYAVHPKCAMQSDVCDGKELEGEPDQDTYENLKMFKEEGDGIIRHLSHPNHQMRLEKMIQIRSYDDDSKYCQACMVSFHNGDNVYACMQCDFFLHESCVYIPRVKEFMLHVHPLILELNHSSSWFKCQKCYRKNSCSFRYECRLQGCSWTLDTLCASISEPFDYHSHPHPLFITCDENTFNWCSICTSYVQQPLNCIQCKFVLCFSCATLPCKAKYEHDDHLLSFSYLKDANDDDANDDANDDENLVLLCEICEKYINIKFGVYACHECQVMVHIECLLGKYPYIKPGPRLMVGRSMVTVNVLPNTAHSTRPICLLCERRCPYKTKIENSFGEIFCSIDCSTIPRVSSK